MKQELNLEETNNFLNSKLNEDLDLAQEYAFMINPNMAQNKIELQQNLCSLEQIDLDCVASQYKVYNYLTETDAQDQDAITAYINNMPSWDRIWWKRGALLGNDIFEAKIGDYEGRQSVIDFSKDEKYQNLSQEHKDKYFCERKRNGAHDTSNDRVAPKLRLFQDKDWKAYDNIKENFAKQDHIPQEVKAIVTPYLEQMWVIREDRDEAYYNAVGANILKIDGYNSNNNDHMRRAMKAWAALKSFYGEWMTDTKTIHGTRHVGVVYSDAAWRCGLRYTIDVFDLVLWD
jgi:hypothetical protein